MSMKKPYVASPRGRVLKICKYCDVAKTFILLPLQHTHALHRLRCTVRRAKGCNVEIVVHNRFAVPRSALDVLWCSVL